MHRMFGFHLILCGFKTSVKQNGLNGVILWHVTAQASFRLGPAIFGLCGDEGDLSRRKTTFSSVNGASAKHPHGED